MPREAEVDSPLLQEARAIVCELSEQTAQGRELLAREAELLAPESPTASNVLRAELPSKSAEQQPSLKA